MKEQNRKLLDKAARAIHAAEVLLAAGEADSAAGRTYYAMFYAPEALLYVSFRQACVGEWGDLFLGE